MCSKTNEASNQPANQPTNQPTNQPDIHALRERCISIRIINMLQRLYRQLTKTRSLENSGINGISNY
uniref:Uncharacterized protein n=1 Tax=Glossina palpalis gambiensis TaxID=67801 RepID=A0A1B0AQP2_9MUSC